MDLAHLTSFKEKWTVNGKMEVFLVLNFWHRFGMARPWSRSSPESFQQPGGWI